MSEPDPCSDNCDDPQLVQAINAGDEEAFATLYERYHNWVVALAYRFTGNPDDAMDVLQETFAYLLRKVPHLHLSAKITTFLYPVVKNLALAIRRKKQPELRSEELLDQMPAAIAPANELDAVIRCLPLPHREVLLMRFVDDLSIEEVAMALGIPPGTVKSRLHNAIQTLRTNTVARKYFQNE